MEDYDVVVDVLEKHYNKLFHMTISNMNSEFGLGITDDIRFKQMDQLQQAIDMWKGRE